MNIILIGFMGTGKTAVGKRLAKRLGWRFVDVDQLIETAAGMPIAKIFSKRGEPVFRRLERRVIARVVRGQHQVVATGGGAFVDLENRRRLRASGTVICLTARPQVILARIGKQPAARPLLTNGERPLAKIRALLTKRASAYAKADLTVETSDRTVDDVVERIWREVGPCVCRSWQYVLDHSQELAGRYAGRYVAVVNDRIVASGDTQLEVYKKLGQRRAPQHEPGIYYIPLPQESLTAF